MHCETGCAQRNQVGLRTQKQRQNCFRPVGARTKSRRSSMYFGNCSEPHGLSIRFRQHSPTASPSAPRFPHTSVHLTFQTYPRPPHHSPRHLPAPSPSHPPRLRPSHHDLPPPPDTASSLAPFPHSIAVHTPRSQTRPWHHSLRASPSAPAFADGTIPRHHFHGITVRKSPPICCARKKALQP